GGPRGRRQWVWDWPATEGSHTLHVRATDASGAVRRPPSTRPARAPCAADATPRRHEGDGRGEEHAGCRTARLPVR
ncbi:hypothetical protein, partial [Streptomyces albidoflavus]|uniref:hypothetical protein n=1 Tax=Streptomyces albidoflavus TaxID=1886 RepID=UPI003F5DA981